MLCLMLEFLPVYLEKEILSIENKNKAIIRY